MTGVKPYGFVSSIRSDIFEAKQMFPAQILLKFEIALQ